MNEAANAHSASLGALQLVRDLGLFWVIRSHEIEYRKQTYAGEKLVVHTWIENFKRVRSSRCFRFERDGEVVALGKTDYVLLNAQTEKPCSIPAEVIAVYQLEES